MIGEIKITITAKIGDIGKKCREGKVPYSLNCMPVEKDGSCQVYHYGAAAKQDWCGCWIALLLWSVTAQVTYTEEAEDLSSSCCFFSMAMKAFLPASMEFHTKVDDVEHHS